VIERKKTKIFKRKEERFFNSSKNDNGGVGEKPKDGKLGMSSTRGDAVVAVTN